MDCKKAEEHLEAYLLGALESREMDEVRHHVDTCAECSSILYQHGSVAADLALAVPQISAPPHLKRQLLSRIEAAAPRSRSRRVWGNWSGLLPRLSLRLATPIQMAVAPILILGMVLGWIWFNNRLSDIAEEKEALADKIEIMAEGEAEMKQMVKDQRYLTYMSASPGLTVNVLSGTERWGRARGIVMIPQGGDAPFLAALGLPPLPKDKTYQVWLIVLGRMYSAGTFTVDSTGYAQTRINLPMTPLHKIDAIEAIVITVEQAGGSPGPTGESVLRGDL